MNKELTQKLVKRFPVLYQQFYDPMSTTCMCWGFDHGDGWFDIIWQLSLAIEDELGYSWLQERSFLLKKKLSKRWNDLIYKLSPVRKREYKMVGKGTKEEPYHQELVHYDPPRWDERIVQALFGKTQKLGQFEVERVGLKGLVWHPYTGFAVSQVKEKFGTLRYYCSVNDRIQHLVDLAEICSAHTCELCGKYSDGVSSNHGWLSTLCKEHAKERK